MLDHPFFLENNISNLLNMFSHLMSNFIEINKQIFSNQLLNNQYVYAYSWYSTYGGIFPTWFSSLGVLLFIIYAKKRTIIYCSLLVIIGIAPGILAFRGLPGLSRISLSISVLLTIISLGFIYFFDQLKSFKKYKFKFLFFLLVIFTNLTSYFLFSREDNDLYDRNNTTIDSAINIIKKNYVGKKIIVACPESVTTVCLYTYFRYRNNKDQSVDFHWITHTDYLMSFMTENHVLITYSYPVGLNEIFNQNFKLMTISHDLIKLHESLKAFGVHE